MKQLVMVRAADMREEAKELRAQYFALRTRAFEAKWGANFYPEGPDAYDRLGDTSYALLVEEGKVIAGARALFHCAGDARRTLMEANHPEFDIHALLPQANFGKLNYCELGGIVSDPDTQYLDQHLGTQVTEGTLKLLKAGVMCSRTEEGRTAADIVIASASSLGLGPIVRAANRQNIEGVIRHDLEMEESDTRFKTKLTPLVMKLRNFSQDLVTEEMKRNGAQGEYFADYAAKKPDGIQK